MKKTICLVPSVLNEAQSLDKFLKHHSWVDEIIVVDSGSRDNSESVCKAYNRKFIFRSVNGNYNQRAAWVVKQTTADWVFFIDPDEFISEELKEEILSFLSSKDNRYAAYETRRINYFMDKRLENGGWSGYSLKLFRKGFVEFKGDAYHEKPFVNGQIGRLKGSVHHYPSSNIYWMLQKLNYISEFDLNEYYNKFGVLTERKFKWLLLTKPFKNFWKGYIKKKGYKDGLHGFIYAALIWAEDVIRICKYGEKFIVKNPNLLPQDKLSDPWECRKR